jgi:hypothetical protein
MLAFFNRFRRSWGRGRKSSLSGPRSCCSKAARPRRRRLALEEFEPRVTPSCDTPHLDHDFGTLTTNCTGGPNTVTLDHSGSTTIFNGFSFSDFVFSAIAIYNIGTAGDTDNILRIPASRPLTIQGNGGRDTVNLGTAPGISSSSVREILSTVNVSNPPAGGYTLLNVDDRGDGTYRSVLVTASAITGLAPAAINYVQSDVSGVNVSTGSGGADVSVFATPSNSQSPVTSLAGFSNNTHVIVANSGLRLQDIKGTLVITNPPSYTAIEVYNSNDPADYPLVKHETVPVGGATYGKITGLGAAPILYKYGDTGAVGLHTGTGRNDINISGTGKPLGVIGNSNATTVTIGNAGRLNDIHGRVNITNFSAASAVIVDDSTDPVAHPNVKLDIPDGVNGSLTGLAPVSIDMRTDRVNSLTIKGGNGGDTFNINKTWTATQINGGAGNNTFNLGDSGPPPAVSTINGLHGALTIDGGPGVNQLNINDQSEVADSSRHYDMSPGMVTRVWPAKPLPPIKYARTNMKLFPSSTVNVLGTAAGSTTTVTTGGSDSLTVNVGNASNKLDDIRGPLIVSGGGGTNALTLHDEGNPVTQTFTISAPSIARTGIAPINYAGIQNVVVQVGSSPNTRVKLQSTPAGCALATVQPGPPQSGFLSGPDVNTTWNITGSNTGTLSSSAFGGPVNFAGFGSLFGGSANDTFIFANGASVSGSIDGGAGTNALDYSAYSTSVIVNLQLGTATGVGSPIANIQNVSGGNGGAVGTYNILVGNGRNVLIGGNGRRNLLIAGASASTLRGGDDDDILIAGTTVYDSDLTALQAIMAEWARTDEDYATRVANLTSGSGVPLLDPTTVTGNGGGNTMIGKNGGATELNLFYGNLALDVYDWDPATETFISV